MEVYAVSSFQKQVQVYSEKHRSSAERSMMQWFVVPLCQAVVIIRQAQKPSSEIKSIHLHFSFLTSECNSRGCDIHSPRMCNAKMSVNFDAQSDTVWEQMHHTVCLASVVSISGFALCFHWSCVYICCHSPWIHVIKSVTSQGNSERCNIAHRNKNWHGWELDHGIWNFSMKIQGFTSNHQSCSTHV